MSCMYRCACLCVRAGDPVIVACTPDRNTSSILSPGRQCKYTVNMVSEPCLAYRTNLVTMSVNALAGAVHTSMRSTQGACYKLMY